MLNSVKRYTRERRMSNQQSGVLAGYRDTDGLFGNRGCYVYLWSLRDIGPSAWTRILNYGHTHKNRNTFYKSCGFSAIFKAKGGQA